MVSKVGAQNAPNAIATQYICLALTPLSRKHCQ